MNRANEPFDCLVVGQFESWLGEHPREPLGLAAFGSRGRSPHQTDRLPIPLVCFVDFVDEISFQTSFTTPQ
jgi:hypothetical protein